MKIKVYVGCGLTKAPKKFRKKVDRLKELLGDEYEIFDFIGLEKGTVTDVYHWDIHRCVAQCQLFVAVCDYPAIGLGYEMGVAIEKHGTPTLALAHEKSKITRLVLGIDHPNYTFQRYRTIKDIVRLVREKEAEHFLNRFLQPALEFEETAV
jgi:hypothetical protein